MSFTYIEPTTTIELQKIFVDWLNQNLIDPYERATGKPRSKWVFGEDFQIKQNYPLLHVDIIDFDVAKTHMTGIINFLETELHHFLIVYYNQRGHYYTFENGLKLNNEQQAMQYLQYVSRELKKNFTAFKTYCHNPSFGKIPKPAWRKQTNSYVGILPFTVQTHRR